MGRKSVAIIETCKYMELCCLEVELAISGCNDEVAASQSGHYTEVPLSFSG